MSAQPHESYPPDYMTEAEYLDFERDSDLKHEYFDGMIVAMAGAKRKHNLITMGTSASLYAQIVERPSEVYQGDMRVKAEGYKSYAYPDVVVMCGQPEFEDDEFDTLLNPIVLVEVLSSSTEKNDRGIKFHAYRQLDTLQDYLIISQVRPHIEHYTKRNHQWLLTDVIDLDAVMQLPSINCTLALSDVYRKVSFDSGEQQES